MPKTGQPDPNHSHHHLPASPFTLTHTFSQRNVAPPQTHKSESLFFFLDIPPKKRKRSKLLVIEILPQRTHTKKFGTKLLFFKIHFTYIWLVISQ